MSYYLWKAILGRTSKIEITKEEHDTIFASWRAISVVADIEEEWDCLVQHYIALEMELLRSAMHSMVLNHESYHEFQQLRLGFSRRLRSEEHTSELQSLMRISYAVFCLKTKRNQ